MALVGNISGSGGVSNTVGVTGSLIIANPGLAEFPTFPGNDVSFFVSGSIGGKGVTSTRSVSVFGGDAVVSGTLTIGTGSITISSNEIVFQGGAAKIYSGTNGLTLQDSGGTRTLSQIIAGGGGGGTGTNFFSEVALKSITASGSVAFIGDETGKLNAAAAGTDVVFFVSGAIGANPKTAVFGGNVTASGSLTINDNPGGSQKIVLGNAGTISGSSDLSVGGNITVAGNIAGDAAGAKAIFANAGANSVTIGGSTSTVVIPGSLTVNGDVVAIDATHLRVEDRIILIASGGSPGTSRTSVVAFASGSKTTNNSLIFGAAGGDDTLAAAILDVQDGQYSTDPISFSSLAKVKAAAYKVSTENAQIKAGGTTDSIVVSGSIVSLQSPAKTGINILNSDGTEYAAINQAIGDATFRGTGNTWFSGSAVFLQSDSGAISVAKNNNTALELSTDGATAGTIAAKSGSPSNVARALTLTGSTVTIGANNSPNGVTFTGAGVNLVNLSAAASSQPSFVASQNNAAFKIGTGGGTTDTLIISGSAIHLNAGSNGQSFRRDNVEFLLISSGASGASQRSLVTAAAGKTLVVGGTSESIFSGSSVTIRTSVGGNPEGVTFSTDVAGTSQGYLQVTSGSYNYGVTTSLNVSKIVGSISPTTPKDLLLGASNNKDLHLSGSNVYANHAAAGGLTLFSEGQGYLRVASSNTAGTSITSNVTGRDVTISTAGAGRLFLSGSTTTLSGSSINFVNDGTRVAFFGVSGNSTGLIPNTTNTYDLGTPDLRWRNMYTGDLHLKNERGDWTIIEEREYLSITNNKSGRRFKFVLEEI